MLVAYYGSFFLVDVLVDQDQLVRGRRQSSVESAELLERLLRPPSFLGHLHARKAPPSCVSRGRTQDAASTLEAAEKVIGS